MSSVKCTNSIVGYRILKIRFVCIHSKRGLMIRAKEGLTSDLRSLCTHLLAI